MAMIMMMMLFLLLCNAYKYVRPAWSYMIPQVHINQIQNTADILELYHKKLKNK